MTLRPRKRPVATENDSSTKRKPAYKRQPDLYYTHVWLDREIYAQVLAFIGWERRKKYSIKMAVRILLELGLKHYIIEQINLANEELAKADREDRDPVPPSDFIEEFWKKTRGGRRRAG